eukprot:753475-Hanusia_phi.AAC.1
MDQKQRILCLREALALHSGDSSPLEAKPCGGSARIPYGALELGKALFLCCFPLAVPKVQHLDLVVDIIECNSGEENARVFRGPYESLIEISVLMSLELTLHLEFDGSLRAPERRSDANTNRT